MTDVSTARTEWEAAMQAMAGFPAFADAVEPGQEQPDEDWFHEIAALEIAEAEARHALQRAELAADPDPEGSWSLPVIRGACRYAITMVADRRHHDILTSRLADALRLYASDDEQLDMADRHRVEYMLTVAGVRAALPDATARVRQHVTDKLLAAIAEGIQHPDELDTSAPGRRRCAAVDCTRGDDGGPAMFVPTASSHQQFCSATCRKRDFKAKAKAAERG